MTVTIAPSKAEGTITAPPSKSVTHRAIVLAALTEGQSIIKKPLMSDDTNVTIQGLKSMGIPIDIIGDEVVVHGGVGQLMTTLEPIDLASSGTSLRILTGIATLVTGETVFTGSKRLLERPMDSLVEAIAQIGATVVIDRKQIRIKSNGQIQGGEIRVDASKSSQFLTSLLLISPFTKKDVVLSIRGLRSSPYAKLTLAMMRQFGVHTQADDNLTEIIIPGGQKYKPQSLTVEGDYSSSSYLFAAAAVTQGKVTVKNLPSDSQQGDKYFLEILEKMGCVIHEKEDTVSVEGTALRAVTLDLGDYPDIVQSVAIVAAVAKGETILTNIAHLKHKETDRLIDTASELKKFGIQVIVESDSLHIQGGKPRGATVETHGDHRMAMAFSVLGLVSDGETRINNADVITKSYPAFFTDLRKIGANIMESI